MITKAALILSLALSLADGCGAGSRPGSDKGGDNNPSTGECEITFSETVNGKFHKYPELVEGTNFIYGKVLVTCAIPPKTHRIELHLQTRKPGAGNDWRQRQFGESNSIPNPKGYAIAQASCDPGTDAYWRLYVHITGSGVTEAGGQRSNFDVEDYSEERLIRCPKKK